MKQPKFEYWQAKDYQWYWHLKAKNGRITADGGGFNTKYGCLKSIARFVYTVQRAVIKAL